MRYGGGRTDTKILKLLADLFAGKQLRSIGLFGAALGSAI
jgi:hypothetical protein